MFRKVNLYYSESDKLTTMVSSGISVYLKLNTLCHHVTMYICGVYQQLVTDTVSTDKCCLWCRCHFFGQCWLSWLYLLYECFHSNWDFAPKTLSIWLLLSCCNVVFDVFPCRARSSGQLDMSDLTWEQRERVLRYIFARINGTGKTAGQATRMRDGDSVLKSAKRLPIGINGKLAGWDLVLAIQLFHFLTYNVMIRCNEQNVIPNTEY